MALDKKIIIGGALLLGVFAYSGNKGKLSTGSGSSGDMCTTYYSLNGNKVCETELIDYGYLYWTGGTDGDGWYHYTQFRNEFGIPDENHKDAYQGLARVVMNPSASNYTTSANMLRDTYKGGGKLTEIA